LLVLATSVHAEEAVTVLNPENFESIALSAEKDVLVEFYAPWCGHCKSLAPVYEQVAQAFAGESNCVLANLDADAHGEIGTKYGVSGFPTIKFFPKGATEAVDYDGGRDAQAFLDFMNGKCGTNVQLPREVQAVKVLDPSNFDSIALSDEKDVLVEFYAPWCGHCKSLAPVYEKVAQAFAGESNCVVANVDADAHRELGTKFDVSGFPTIKFFPKGSKAEEYNGGRTEGDFIKFLNEKCGTERVSGGSLSKRAGRVDFLDDYVKNFVSADDEGRLSIVETTQTATVQKGMEKSAAYYAKVMQKMIVQGDSYASTELDRLTRMGDGQMKADKYDWLVKRKNILKVFRNAVTGEEEEKEENDTEEEPEEPETEAGEDEGEASEEPAVEEPEHTEL